ncbi:MAG: AbrB/MazE/SpoVT family DNA-binding domain-containing protein [Betaproteobacteria bacterium]|nr:AbrB/MazE/SpoVT family DNA-binding domain-containing protein [Betaproteobacteria bacterium]
MATTTLSSKFQISIPKEIREEMRLKAGQKFTFLRKGNTIQLVPVRPIDEFFGAARGADTSGYRDRSDRLERYAHARPARRKGK